MADAAAPHAAGTVKIAGQTMSKKTLMVAGVVAGGVLAYAWYRRSKNAAAAPAAAAGDAASVDPATGYPYGSAEDTAALAAQDTGSNTDTTGLGSYGIDPATGIPYATELADAGGGTSSGGGSTVTTNAQWEQECIANMQAGGLAAASISNAEAGLPRYLAHLQLSAAQSTAVQIAVGLTGPPPEGGPYSIIVSPPLPTPTGGTVTVPRLAGDRVDDASSALESAGLKASVPHRITGKAYWVTASSPAAGAKVAAGSTVKLSVTEKAPKV